METAKIKGGRITIPRHLRAARDWREGQVLEVVETRDGLLIREQKVFPATTLDQIAGCLTWDGPSVPVEELNISRIDYRDIHIDEGD